MKKEIFLAVLFGVIVALLVSIVIYRGQLAKQPVNDTEEKLAVGAQVDETTGLNANEKIKITFPVESEVYSEKAVTIAGRVWPGALVAIFVNDKQELVTADAQGNFSLETNLESGSNVITARALDEQDTEFFSRVTVIYSNKNLEETLVSDSEVEAEAETAQ